MQNDVFLDKDEFGRMFDNSMRDCDTAESNTGGQNASKNLPNNHQKAISISFTWKSLREVFRLVNMDSVITFLLPNVNSKVLIGEQFHSIFLRITSIANNNEHLVSVGVKDYNELNKVDFEAESTVNSHASVGNNRQERNSKRQKSVHIDPCRPVVRRIATENGNDGMEDDNGMELLVNNKIISLDLPVRDVFKKVWLTEVISEHDPMRVVYRMTGLSGDATEDIIDIKVNQPLYFPLKIRNKTGNIKKIHLTFP